MKLRIRTLIATDMYDLYALFKETFHEDEKGDFRDAWKLRNRESTLGLFEEGVLVAFCLVTGSKIAYLGTDVNVRKKGYGSLLLNKVLQTQKNFHLIPVDSIPLIKWYEKHGFQISQVRVSDTPGVPYRLMSYHPYGTRSKCSS